MNGTGRSQPGQPNFTGALVGMTCQNTSGEARAADFRWFDYEERDYQPDPTGD